MTSVADYIQQIELELGPAWLPRIYRERILKMRTRSYEFPSAAPQANPQIHHTLLGIELKFGRRRLLCPDLATARYLSVFARIGVRAIAIPYDITRISLVADELESSWHRMLLLAHTLTNTRAGSFQTRVRRQLIGKVHAEVAEAGAGPQIPEFKPITKIEWQPRKGTKSPKEEES
jgi:hypothetical protein